MELEGSLLCSRKPAIGLTLNLLQLVHPFLRRFYKIWVYWGGGGGQNSGNARKLRNRICVGYGKELKLATLNVLSFVYTL
jgi:hypothetical protein